MVALHPPFRHSADPIGDHKDSGKYLLFATWIRAVLAWGSGEAVKIPHAVCREAVKKGCPSPNGVKIPDPVLNICESHP